MVLPILFFVFAFLFAGCDLSGGDVTYTVKLYLDGSLYKSVEVKKDYKVPATDKTIAAHVAEQGLYMKPRNWDDPNPDVQYNAQILEQYMSDLESYFWSVQGGLNDGTIWDFNDPVTEDMSLAASDTDPPWKYNIAGIKKEFYDNAMLLANNPAVVDMGVRVLLLREDVGYPDNEALGLYDREVNNVTFLPGSHLGMIGVGRERTIYGKGSGMFVLPGNSAGTSAWAGFSLTLGNNITIKGRLADGGSGMIRVGDAALSPVAGGGRPVTFTMLPGSKVTGYISNANNGQGGAAIVVEGISTSTSSNVLFQMKGGTVTGNSNTWTGGGIGSGVTLNNARMIMSGNAVITGNSGFGGDLAFGNGAGNNIFFLELDDNATIGEVFLFNNSSSSPVNNIRIRTGWSGSIQKLNLGWGGTGNFTFNSWSTNAIVTNPDGGSINGFLGNITLGDSFQWSNGDLTPNGLDAYQINSAGYLSAR